MFKADVNDVWRFLRGCVVLCLFVLSYLFCLRSNIECREQRSALNHAAIHMYTEFLFRNTKRSSFGFTETNLLIYFEKKKKKKTFQFLSQFTLLPPIYAMLKPLQSKQLVNRQWSKWALLVNGPDVSRLGLVIWRSAGKRKDGGSTPRFGSPFA